MRKTTLILITIIVLFGLVSYINVFHHQFLWDDEFLIQENIFIRSWKNLPQMFSTCSGAGAGRLDNFYRPMQLLAYTGIYSLFGLQPWAFLSLNVLIHLINACLIFFLIKKLFKKDFLAFLTSILWVVHPVHTEVVTYMSGIADPLIVLFGLSSFLCYVNFKQKKQAYLLIFSLILFILALLSKETIIIFPGLLIIYELFFSPVRDYKNTEEVREKQISNGVSKKDWKKYIHLSWFFIIAISYFFLRLTALNFVNSFNFYNTSNIYTEHLSVRIFTFLASLPKYYSFLFYPVNLHMERQFPVFTSIFSINVLSSLLILVLLGIVVYFNIKQKKFHLSFGIFWFFIGFLPMTGIIPVNSFLLEHWLYLPSIGFFLCLAVIIQYFWLKYPHIKKLIVIFLTIIVFILMGLTLKRNIDWQNPIVFYNNILKYNEGTARVHNNLGMAYADKDDVINAEKYYLKAIETSDQYPQVHYNLARLYLEEKEQEKAIEHLEKSIEINPDFFFSYQLLGDIFKQQGEIEKAQEYYQKAKNIQYY
ncbi:tetratricopeptide repeat protein [Patescibacteria group bacterium]|nr:tetratricopeptide repeat protein [Patescibacteria group bacterium]